MFKGEAKQRVSLLHQATQPAGYTCAVVACNNESVMHVKNSRLSSRQDSAPVLLRDRAGEGALLSRDGALLLGRERGRVVAGDEPLLATLGLSGRAGAAVRSGLHKTN